MRQFLFVKGDLRANIQVNVVDSKTIEVTVA
jgi:hypothetical protein